MCAMKRQGQGWHEEMRTSQPSTNNNLLRYSYKGPGVVEGKVLSVELGSTVHMATSLSMESTCNRQAP